MFRFFVSEHNDNIFDLTQCMYMTYIRKDVREWLEIYGKNYDWYWKAGGCVFQFKDKEMAVLFKITWL